MQEENHGFRHSVVSANLCIGYPWGFEPVDSGSLRRARNADCHSRSTNGNSNIPAGHTNAYNGPRSNGYYGCCRTYGNLHPIAHACSHRAAQTGWHYQTDQQRGPHQL